MGHKTENTYICQLLCLNSHYPPLNPLESGCTSSILPKWLIWRLQLPTSSFSALFLPHSNITTTFSLLSLIKGWKTEPLKPTRLPKTRDKVWNPAKLTTNNNRKPTLNTLSEEDKRILSLHCISQNIQYKTRSVKVKQENMNTDKEKKQPRRTKPNTTQIWNQRTPKALLYTFNNFPFEIKLSKEA